MSASWIIIWKGSCHVLTNAHSSERPHTEMPFMHIIPACWESKQELKGPLEEAHGQTDRTKVIKHQKCFWWCAQLCRSFLWTKITQASENQWSSGALQNKEMRTNQSLLLAGVLPFSSQNRFLIHQLMIQAGEINMKRHTFINCWRLCTKVPGCRVTVEASATVEQEECCNHVSQNCSKIYGDWC